MDKLVEDMSMYSDGTFWKGPKGQPVSYEIPTPSVRVERDPAGTPANAPGAKLDSGKVRAWLALSGFASALEEVAKVTSVGANKYTPNGWKEVPDGYSRYMDAFARHMLAYGRGERVDDGPGGTGCLHIAQMVWNLLAAMELEGKK